MISKLNENILVSSETVDDSAIFLYATCVDVEEVC